MKLYIEGHNAKRGYAISRTYSNAECSSLPVPHECDSLSPIRFIVERSKAFTFVERYNRRFATR